MRPQAEPRRVNAERPMLPQNLLSAKKICGAAYFPGGVKAATVENQRLYYKDLIIVKYNTVVFLPQVSKKQIVDQSLSSLFKKG